MNNFKYYRKDDKEFEIPKFNIFWYGYDHSHCGSCRDWDDEKIHVLMTTLTKEEMITKLKDYLDEQGNTFKNITSFEYDGFLRWVSENSELYEDEEGSRHDHISLYFEKEGTSYCPDFEYERNPLVVAEYDCEKELDPSDVLEPDFWLKCVMDFEERKKLNAEKNKKNEEIRERAWDLVRKYKSDRKEYLELMKMKEKLGGTKHIPLPKKPSFSEYENNLHPIMRDIYLTQSYIQGKTKGLKQEIKEIKEDVL